MTAEKNNYRLRSDVVCGLLKEFQHGTIDDNSDAYISCDGLICVIHKADLARYSITQQSCLSVCHHVQPMHHILINALSYRPFQDKSIAQ